MRTSSSSLESIMASLPVAEVIPSIQQTLLDRHELVLQAPPGAGKTTCVPLALLNAPWLGDKKILLLEPRRLAARNAANRMADMLGEKVGETVGYRMRMDTRVSDKTKIEVITEGVLTRLLQNDPALSEIALVIFDECHERNLNTDLGLALCLEGRGLFRNEDDPLRLIAMSATLDGDALAALLDDAPMLTSEGRMYPVDINYHATANPVNAAPHVLVDNMVNTITRALDETDGSLLVFLPGQGEIQRVQTALKNQLPADGPSILPLYGSLSIDAQQAAIQPTPNQRKIVLATDIAETSLTIEGVSVVIDSGLARKPQYDPTTATARLKTQRISQASATQRMGRAGRMTAGSCYRLWSEEQQHQLAQHSEPEIRQTDLSGLVLQLLQWGCHDPAELNWLDVPSPALYQQALDLLTLLGAVSLSDKGPSLTEHGQRMAGLPVEPRLAHLLVSAAEANASTLGAQIAALLSERLPSQAVGDELDDYLALIANPKQAANHLKAWAQRCHRQAKHYEKLLSNIKGDNNSAPTDAGHLIALAFPDRIAKQKSANGCQYQLANGRQASISENSPLRRHPWLAVAELSGRESASGKSADDKIHLACALSPSDFETGLAGLVNVQDHVHWDMNEGRLIAERQHKVGRILLKQRPVSKITGEQRLAALHNALNKRGTALLNWTPALRQWQARVECLRALDADGGWPDVSESGLLNSLEDWFDPFADKVTNQQTLSALPLESMLQSLLPWPLPQTLDELAPTHLKVPSGSRIAIDYLEQPPVLAVKLQEMFGSTHTPTIAKGKLALKLHLLSPAGRPLQVTQNLETFWQEGYESVKKEMKGRYPKHPWPDDPLTFVATAKTKRHL